MEDTHISIVSPRKLEFKGWASYGCIYYGVFWWRFDRGRSTSISYRFTSTSDTETQKDRGGVTIHIYGEQDPLDSKYLCHLQYNVLIA